jgi:nitrite reductase/ring-hydroxylating ferredoxin subunit
VARVGGREIGVVMDGDQPKAIRNRCPHMGAPARRVLHCPWTSWHGWEFDLDSGICADDVRMRAAVYPVRVDDGRVLVEA